MSLISETHLWALDTFGRAELGDHRRTRRLVGMASILARSPAGTVTASFVDSAEREGAFRFLSNDDAPAAAVASSLGTSTLSRCKGTVFCAIDGATLSLSDWAKCRDVGAVGSWTAGGRGLNALTSLAVDRQGAPIGVCDVEFWARTKRSPKQRKPHKALERETAHTVEFLNRIEDARTVHAPGARLWYQLDRGFDCWPLFQLARDRKLLITVRASSPHRRLWREGTRRQRYLKQAVKNSPVLGWYVVQVPEGRDRPARQARLRIQVAKVALVLQVGKKRKERAEVTAILAEEEGYFASDRLRWLLLTTADVNNLNDACDVVDGYTVRWRIEDLHRAWKRGWCNVERTQLRKREALCKWATIHLAVAARALRLTKLARSEPERPATDEFTREEIDAAIILRTRNKRTTYKPGDTPTLGEVVRMVADLGGYTGPKSSGGPPGATVIGRGLTRIASLAEGLLVMRGEM